MKYSLGISNFFEEISSLSHSIVFFSFFTLITEEGFLISPCYSLELCIQCVYFSFSPLLFTSLLFTAIYKASSDSHFAILHFFFLGMVLFPVFSTMSWTSVQTPGHLPGPGIEPMFLASPALAGGFFTTAPLHMLNRENIAEIWLHTYTYILV